MNFTELATSKLVPSAFREFLPFVSPSGLRVIHKERVLSLALACTSNTLRSNAYGESVETARKILAGTTTTSPLKIISDSAIGIELTRHLKAASAPERKKIGETILELYFLLIEAPVPFFLDLRPEHFRWNSVTGELLWHPSRLWFQPSAHFRDRLRSLYRGFFFSDDNETRKGLELYAWEAAPSDGYFQRVTLLLNAHFGEAHTKEVLFSIHHFKATFALLFEETIRSRSRLHPELTFVGTALAGLYVTLEQIATPLDVAKSYRNATRS